MAAKRMTNSWHYSRQPEQQVDADCLAVAVFRQDKTAGQRGTLARAASKGSALPLRAVHIGQTYFFMLLAAV